MTTMIGSGGGRRIPKEKRNQSNKSNNSVINNTNASESDHNLNNNHKLKIDPKLQPTAEQIRIANLMNDRIDDNDLKKKIDQIIELTGSSRDEAVVALHDCDNDTAKAIDMILEGYVESEWRSTGKKKKPPKTTTNQTVDENTKPDVNPNKESKIENRDPFKQPFNKSDKPSNRVGVRGGGPPRLQRAALANRGPRKPKEFSNNFNNKNERNDFEHQNNDIFSGSAQQSFRSSMDSSSGPRRTDRRGRGRGGLGRGGNRGAFSSSLAGGRGSRTFQNRGLQSNDGFPNSIDTWSNSTADQTQTKTTVSTDCNTMTVGNWSDIVANEDWSEEDCEPNHMETKVFTPSTKMTEKEEMLDVNHSSNISSSQSSNLSQFIGKPSVDTSQPSMSSILSASMSRNNVTGQSLLQQIQQSGSSQATTLSPYSLSQYSKQATESIKSLVGLSSTSNYNSTNADLLSSNDRDLDNQLSNSQTSNLSNKGSRMKVTRSASKIPESAVEMPTNDSIAALGVHFGTFDICSDNSQFSLANDNSVFQDSVSHVTKPKKPESNSLSTSSILTQSTDNTFRSQTNPNMNDGINKGVPSSIIQNSVLGHQSLTSDSLIDRSSKSNINPYGQKVIDRNNKSTVDYTSVSPQQNDITSTYKTTNYSEPTYNSVTASYPYSSNSQSMSYSNQVGNYSSNFSGSTLNNHSNSSAQKLRDIDTNSQQKQYDVSNAIPTNPGMGLISSSTVTTNVLKNALSATGKNVHNVPPGVSATPVMSTPYLVGNTGLPIYPMGIPYDVQFQTTPRDHNFATYAPQDVKYGRGSDADVIPVSSSQTASQTHNQTFVNTLPPGYGFFYAPGVNMMAAQGIYQTAPPIYPVAQPQTNAGSAASAFAKANSSYGSHSYGSGYDSLSGVPQTQDYVKQSYPQSVQHNKGISGSNTSDLSTNSSIYNKSHSQMNKSYDKQGFQGANPPFNLTAGAQSGGMSSAYGPYVLPHSQQTISLHHSLQSDVSQGSGPGVTGQRNMSQTHKSSTAGTGNYTKYNWG